ncbi:hypothetical protein PBY51_014903 [Eleginops maclovinus]|uniref:non-specific serine/threonine protein kinase n=1 Tax=Eleginops maclovinus TaxID=56733 RepID=A0AAN7X3A0_ELEMC|nr:hypothetical protein PBY51_014903 [Eleginops maclovinus]
MGKKRNYIAQLETYARKARWELTYEDMCSEGPEPNERFSKRAVVNGKYFPIGVGNNPKQAKWNAAKSALSCLNEKENLKPVTEKAANNPTAKVPQKNTTKVNLLGVLNVNAPKNRGNIKAGLSTTQEPHDVPQCSSFVVGDKEHPAVTGKPTTEAKEEAANLEKYEIFCSETTEINSGSVIVAPARPPTALETCDAKLKIVLMTDFTNSSSSTKDEEQNPVVKPKTSSKSGSQEVNTGDCPTEKTSTKSEMSRFTSEFDCIESLGEGSFGRVFKALEKLTEKNYAIKIVHYKDIENALQEVKTLSDLNHCNIVRYYTCWLEDSGYRCESLDESASSTQCSINDSSIKYLYIQMELCEYTLREWIDKKNEEKSLQDSKRRKEGLTIVQQIVRGVEYIHSKMLIHRDLKPANIMLGKDEKVTIGDFGLVTVENDAESLREREMYTGTPAYMAPEQKQQKTYDRKVDIFPLGLIYFELLWKLSTVHERNKVWPNIREQKFPKEFQCNFPKECFIIKPMLCEKPEERPEASQLKADIKEIERRGRSRGRWTV